jgi:hypothetical protein
MASIKAQFTKKVQVSKTKEIQRPALIKTQAFAGY